MKWAMKQRNKKSKKGRQEMSEEKRVLELDKYEHRAIVNVLYEKTNKMIENKEDNDFINEVLEKVIYAPVKKKVLFKKEHIRSER